MAVTNDYKKWLNLVGLFILFGMLTACNSAPSKTTSMAKPRHHHHQPQGVVSLDVYQDGARTHLLTGVEGHQQKALHYQFSDDGGQSWSAPVTILDNEQLPVRMGRGRDAQIAARGNTIIAVWTKYTDANRFHTGAMQAAHSVDGGNNWQRIIAPPDWTKGPHGFSDLAASEKGFEAVWLDSRDGKGRQGLRYAFSSNKGESWSKNRTLDEHSCSCCWNVIKNDGAGRSYVIYRDKEPSDMSIGVIDSTDKWQYLGTVGHFDWFFDGCPHIGAGIDFQSKAGKMWIHAVVGTGKQDVAGIYYLASGDDGKSWSKPVRLGDDSAMHADIAASDDGRVIAVWDMMTDQGMGVFMAEKANNGLDWSRAVRLSVTTERATHPRIVATPQGFLALWTESANGQTILKSKRL